MSARIPAFSFIAPEILPSRKSCELTRTKANSRISPSENSHVLMKARGRVDDGEICKGARNC